MGSGLLHGAVMLLAPAMHFEQRTDKPDILTVRLSEVPQVAERLAEPPPPVRSQEPTPATPTPPPPQRPRARAEAPQPAASPPARVPAERPAEPHAGKAPPAPPGITANAPAPQIPPAEGNAPALTPPVFSAAYLKNPPPEYPLAARRRGQEGLVLLAVRVNESGSPVEVRVAESSGSSVLDDAALEAVKRWSFVPARRGDLAIAAWVEVPVRFRLRDR